MKTSGFIAHVARMACMMEVTAEKPGNVTPTKSFPDLAYSDFAKAGEMLEEFVEKAAWDEDKAEIGKLIFNATPGKNNVNFGIILMFIPLAATHGGSTRKLIKSLTPEDTKWIVKAMQRGRLGGMELKDKKLAKYDVLSDKIFEVIEKEKITPLKLMQMSQPHDTLAKEWVNDYPISRAISKSIRIDGDSIVTEYLKTLADYPDTLIARRAGLKEAKKVSQMAQDVLKGNMSIGEFDSYLRSRGNSLNPGTTADLIATGLFLKLLS